MKPSYSFPVCSMLLSLIACSISTPESSYAQEFTAEVESTMELVPTNDSLACGLNFVAGTNYRLSRASIEQGRKELGSLLGTANKDSVLRVANKYFTQELLNVLVPHWYGTTWDFNGYTAKPREGEIACGYFVSTTLQHMGLKLNRYRMAQQSALSEAKTIAMELGIATHYPSSDEVEDLEFCKEMEDGLYLVGLSNHVGYFYLFEGHGYFIHSDYVSGAVRFENATESAAFKSDIYCFAPISSNKALIKKWLEAETVEVVMD